MGNSELKHCKCYPYLKTGMTIQVDKFNPLICSKCKGVIDYAERSQFLPLDEETVQKEMGEMKLSEILKDWPEELENIWYQASGQDCYPIEDAYKDGKCVGFNKAIKYCDHEIDREALAKELFLMDAKDTITWEDDDVDESIREEYREKSNRIISTMPQWLKRFENGKISS